MESTLHFVEVYRARSSAQAHEVERRLQEAGIETRVEDERLEGVVDELPTTWSLSKHILVPETQVEMARPIVEQFDATAPAETETPEDKEETSCLSCGATMGDNEERCPACGWSYSGSDQARLP
jgi:putative signal transducing protein